MRTLRKIQLFFVVTLVISVLGSCTKEETNIGRTLDEVKSLIQSDNLTMDYEQIRQNEILRLLDQDNTSLEDLLKVAKKELVINYYNSILNKYTELTHLSFEQRIETIYNIQFDNIEYELNAIETQIKYRSSTCDNLLDIAISSLEIAVIASEFGLNEVSNRSVAAAVTALNIYRELCT